MGILQVSSAGAVQSSDYTWVDQFDIRLGKDVPIASGNLSGALETLVDGKYVTLRVPCPMGFHAKGLDGRIGGLNLGQKGRGLWSTYAGRVPIISNRQGRDQVVKFRLRPDPPAR